MEDRTINAIERAAEVAALKVFNQMMVQMGRDVSDPLQAQKDMQALRELRHLFGDTDFKADLVYLRNLRLTLAGIQQQGLIAAIGIIVAGVLASLWMGVKQL